MTNFYDVGKPEFANHTLAEVTGEEVKRPDKLGRYLDRLGTSAATTPNMGASYSHTAVVFRRPPFAPDPHPEFALVHELLLHAYGAWWDDPIFENSLFIRNGLYRVGTKTYTISTWMSTDCTCTPENPLTYDHCQPNTARW